MLELGLARIGRLLADSALPWRAIHVAGTNGKGSVCAYASSMLHASGVPCGRFTSPHLIDRWDCITINERTVDERLFYQVENRVKARDAKASIGASEFELLTATAFEIFAQEKIKIGVVEVGLGGRLDATNILENPFVTVISKIGQDHQSLLGNTLEAIAYQKAGIMKSGVPCIVDSTNDPRVLRVLEKYSEEINTGTLTLVPPASPQSQLWDTLARQRYESHQQVNMSLAFDAVRLALDQIQVSPNTVQLAAAIENTRWSGRLQRTSIKSLTGRDQEILIDGAHNSQSAMVLASYVDKRMRRRADPVTWVIAISKGKDLKAILPLLLRPGDNVVTVEFGPVDGMPWVQPTKAEELLHEVKSCFGSRISLSTSHNVRGALQRAADISEGGPLVVAGSLYLVSDILRLSRSAEPP